MDIARDIVNNKIIEAEALWEIRDVDREHYRCVGCGIKIWPASYRREINKKRPYFTLGATGLHIDSCEINGEEALVNRAKSEKMGTQEGFPCPYPNKLVLTNNRPVVNPTGNAQLPEAGAPVHTIENVSRGNHTNHGHTVKTIWPIAKTFLKYPHDRDHLPLQVPNCDGKTFAAVFWRLGKLMRFRQPIHLYYAPLHWKAPTKTDTGIEWQLNAGDWDTVNNRRGISFRVRVDWTEWSMIQRNTLVHETEIIRGMAKESGGIMNAWLFFVGTQSNEDPTLLLVDKYQVICCIEGPKYI